MPGAVSYNVTLITYFHGTITGDGITTTSWTTPNLGDLSSQNPYEWYVQANIKTNGVTTLGPPKRHKTFKLGKVAEPELVSPLPNATIATAYPTLNWTAVPGGIFGYEVNLLDVTSHNTLVEVYQTLAISFTVNFPLTNGHTYTWMILSLDSPSEVGSSAEFTVSIAGGGSEKLAAPKPIGPSGVIRDGPPSSPGPPSRVPLVTPCSIRERANLPSGPRWSPRRHRPNPTWIRPTKTRLTSGT